MVTPLKKVENRIKPHVIPEYRKPFFDFYNFKHFSKNGLQFYGGPIIGVFVVALVLALSFNLPFCLSFRFNLLLYLDLILNVSLV